MKWKGRRESKNVVDQRDDDAIRTIIKNSTVEYDGGASPTPKRKNVEFDPNDKEEMEVVKELGRHNKDKTTPTPTPRPSQKTSRIQKIQVTPGEWKSH